jgi:hypothetical protein
VRQIIDNIRESPELKEVLGDAIRPEPAWYLNGHPWITGSVCLLTHLTIRLKNWPLRRGCIYRLATCRDMQTSAFGSKDTEVGLTSHLLAVDQVIAFQVQELCTSLAYGKTRANHSPSVS